MSHNTQTSPKTSKSTLNPGQRLFDVRLSHASNPSMINSNWKSAQANIDTKMFSAAPTPAIEEPSFIREADMDSGVSEYFPDRSALVVIQDRAYARHKASSQEPAPIVGTGLMLFEAVFDHFLKMYLAEFNIAGHPSRFVFDVVGRLLEHDITAYLNTTYLNKQHNMIRSPADLVETAMYDVEDVVTTIEGWTRARGLGEDRC